MNVEDFDGDGLEDILLWGGQDFATISILFNKGDGTWDAELIAEDVEFRCKC